MADVEPDYDRGAQIQSAFNGLDEETLVTLRRHVEIKTYPADAILVHEGEFEDRMYVVTEGRLVITQAIGSSGFSLSGDPARTSARWRSSPTKGAQDRRVF